MDMRMKFIQAMEERLVKITTPEMSNLIIDEITKELSNYILSEGSTEIVVYDNINERIINRYCACLLIDGKSEKTIAQYRRTINKMLEVIQKHITEIGIYDIRLFLAYEKSRGVSNTTLENTRANISALFQWLTLEEVIDKNPCLNIKPIKCANKVRLPLSAVELDSLRSGCKSYKERALIEVLLSSGVRVSELAEMKISDIDFNDLSVHVIHGKGNKERTTYINDLTKVHLQKYLSSRKERGDHLFYNKWSEPLNPGGIRALLNRIADESGVENVHPHRFRRTFASNLASRGMNIQEIQKLLGHTNVNTTMHYVYTSDDQVKHSYKQYTT